MTPIYARFVAFVTYLAAHAPAFLSSLLGDAGLALVRFARHLPPMPRKTLAPGVPFIALGICCEPECREKQTLFSPYGLNFDDAPGVCCPKCKSDTMVIA